MRRIVTQNYPGSSNYSGNLWRNSKPVDVVIIEIGITALWTFAKCERYCRVNCPINAEIPSGNVEIIFVESAANTLWVSWCIPIAFRIGMAHVSVVHFIPFVVLLILEIFETGRLSCIWLRCKYGAAAKSRAWKVVTENPFHNLFTIF